jgi:hypothetical protein
MVAIAVQSSRDGILRRFVLRHRAQALLRLEDLALAGWVGLASPALAQGQADFGPFDSGHPLDGLLRVAGILGALVCLGTRASDRPAEESILEGASAGPVVAGLMLVGGAGFGALGLAPEPGMVLPLASALVLAGLRSQLPALPTATRRLLITPFVLAAGGIFWTFVRGFVGAAGLGMDVGSLMAASGEVTFGLTILGLCAAVFYAMLIYAPRQLAEREGGPIEWIFRFALFLASMIFGFGWLAMLGG